MKRAHKGVYHKMSAKHLRRYTTEFAGRHNLREKDTVDQMRAVVIGMTRRRLPWRKKQSGTWIRFWFLVFSR